LAAGFLAKRGLGKKRGRKRIYGRKEAAHGFRRLSVIIITAGFERRLTKLQTNQDEIVNKKFTASLCPHLDFPQILGIMISYWNERKYFP
jgi:hypothetical protein